MAVCALGCSEMLKGAAVDVGDHYIAEIKEAMATKYAEGFDKIKTSFSEELAKIDTNQDKEYSWKEIIGGLVAIATVVTTGRYTAKYAAERASIGNSERNERHRESFHGKGKQ